MNGKSKTEAKTEVAVPDKPETGTPETGTQPQKPEPDANPVKAPDLKPDTGPVIGPEPKPAVKPDANPAVKPDARPEVKPDASVGPLQAPSFPAAELDASLKAVSSGATIDAKSYADWCKLAEV